MKTTTNLLLALLAIGAFACSSAPSPTPLSCGPHEDLIVVDEEVEHGISQCAVCARARIAFAEGAARLGCAEAYPLDGCPSDRGLTDCSLWDAQAVTLPVELAEDCDELVARASDLEAYAVRCERLRRPEGV